jgi:phosphatidylglycerol lysyltransferase
VPRTRPPRGPKCYASTLILDADLESILLQYAEDATALQISSPKYRKLEVHDCVVGYVDDGTSWVAAGGPIGPAAMHAAAASSFFSHAKAAHRRAVFFCVRTEFAPGLGHSLQIGEQHYWTRSSWRETLARHASLRAQLSRARNKGLTVGSEVDVSRAATLIEGWQRSRGMPPMAFMVALEPLARAGRARDICGRRLWGVTHPSGELVALALTLETRDSLFVEHMIRATRAPNGTIELLFDALLDVAQEREVTLGLAPLAGGVCAALRWARRLGAPLYDFEGLAAFKKKLRPHREEPRLLIASRGPWSGLWDVLRAFAGGSFLRFGARTAEHMLRSRQLPPASAGLPRE